MYTAWLTLICVVGVGQPAPGPGPDYPAMPPQCCPEPPRDPGETCYKALTGWLTDWFRPMPQTCYSPRYGCYPGNGRDIQRYPAFHGTYYRRAYNYRQLHEWPWLAEPHEPGCCVRPCAAQAEMPPPDQHLLSPFIEEVPVPGGMTSPLPTAPALTAQPQ